MVHVFVLVFKKIVRWKSMCIKTCGSTITQFFTNSCQKYKFKYKEDVLLYNLALKHYLKFFYIIVTTSLVKFSRVHIIFLGTRNFLNFFIVLHKITRSSGLKYNLKIILKVFLNIYIELWLKLCLN